MKSLSKNAKKIFFTLALILSFVVLNNTTLISSIYSASAISYKYSKVSTTIENSDFSNYSRGTTGRPYSVSNGWNVIGDSSVSKGIIDISTKNFESNNKFGLNENPGIDTSITKPDDYILMFSSKTEGSAKATMKKEVTLEKGKFYDISLRVKTTDGALASVSTSLSNQLAFKNIQTSSNWNTLHFVVATDSLENKSLILSLNFGPNDNSKTIGNVFFDHIEVEEIASVDFDSIAEKPASTKKIDFRRNPSPALENFQNANFEDSNFETNGWEIESLSGTPKAQVSISSIAEINATINRIYNNNGSKNYADSFVSSNTKSLFLLNEESTLSSISTTKENTVTIPQHSLYRMRIMYKTNNLSKDGLNISVIPEKVGDEEVKPIEQKNLNSSDEENAYNGFKFADFFIKGSYTQDRKISLKISLGEGSGWAIVDNIEILPITFTEFDGQKSSSTTVDLTSTTMNLNIANGTFDEAKLSDINATQYPLAPANWSYKGSALNKKSGIIRVNPTYFDKDSANFGGIENPGFNNAFFGNEVSSPDNFNENILMIRNDLNEKVSYTSSKVTVSASSKGSTKYSRFEVGVKTLNDAKAFVKILDKNSKVIACIDNINTLNKWETYTIFFTNASTSSEISLEIGVSSGKNSYAFFDCAEHVSLSEAPTKEQLENKNTTYVDLINNTFHSHSSETSYGVYTAYEFDYLDNLDKSTYTFGIVNAPELNVELRKDITDKNLLQLENKLDGYQSIITNYTYTLSKDSVYEISVWIKTDFSGTTLNDKNGGAFFEYVPLTFDDKLPQDRSKNKNKFKDITVTDTDNNGWVKYSMFLLSEEEQSGKIILGLGSKDNKVQGKVYFDDLTVKEIEKSYYAEQKANDTTIVSKAIELPQDNDTDKKEPTTPNEQAPGINIWALASSILLFIALVLAILGYLFRQIPKHPHNKKVKNSEYKKERLDIDVNAIKEESNVKLIKDKADMEQELESLNNEYSSLKAEYEEKISKLEDKTDNKPYAEFTKKANKILEKIAYLESALAYIKDPQNVKRIEKRAIKAKEKEAEEYFLQLNNQMEDSDKKKENK